MLIERNWYSGFVFLTSLFVCSILAGQGNDRIYSIPYENLESIKEVVVITFNSTGVHRSSREMFRDSINTAKMMHIRSLLDQNPELAVTALIYDDCDEFSGVSGMNTYLMGVKDLIRTFLLREGINGERIDFSYLRDRIRLNDEELKDKDSWMKNRRIEFLVFELQ